VNPFVVVHPTHILMHPRVHRAHRLKSAVLQQLLIAMQYILFLYNTCCLVNLDQSLLVVKSALEKHRSKGANIAGAARYSTTPIMSPTKSHKSKISQLFQN